MKRNIFIAITLILLVICFCSKYDTPLDPIASEKEVLSAVFEITPLDTAWNKVHCKWESNAEKSLIDSLGLRPSVGEEDIFFSVEGLKTINGVFIRGDDTLRITHQVFLFITEDADSSVAFTGPPILVIISPDTMIVNETRKVHWQNQNADSLQLYINQELVLTSLDSIGEHKLRFEQPGDVLVGAIAFNSKGTTPRSQHISVIPQTVSVSLDTPGVIIMIQDSAEWGTDIPVEWVTWNANRVISITGVSNPGLNGTASIRFDSTQIGIQIIIAIAEGDSGLTATDRDTVIIVPKAEDPPVDIIAPSVFLTVPDSGTVGIEAPISWYSCNTDSVRSPNIPNPGLSGQYSLIFYTPGPKTVRITAYGNGLTAMDSSVIHITEISQPDTTQPDTTNILVDDTLFVCTLYPTKSVKVDIQNSGYYRIRPRVVYETAEVNETFFLLVKHPSLATVGPANPNIPPYKIVRDMESVDDEVLQYGGHFYMEQGKNTILIFHFSYNGIWDNPDFVEWKVIPTTPPEKVVLNGFVLEPAGQ